MSITELIKAVGGDDAVQFQNLDTDVIRWDAAKDGLVKVSFGTRVVPVSSLLTGDPLAEKLGLVVWFPRKAAMEAIKASKTE